MDCPPKKNGCCREVAISGVSAVVMNLLFHSPVTFDQISNFSLLLFYKKIHHFDNLDRESSSLSIVRGM